VHQWLLGCLFILSSKRATPDLSVWIDSEEGTNAQTLGEKVAVMKGILHKWCRWMLCFSCLWLFGVSGVAVGGNPANDVYVIGDSLSDTGNLYALTNFWPPSPPYAMRYSNGPVWAEYFAQDLDVDLDSRAYGGAFTGVYVVGGIPVSNFNNVQYPTLFPPLPGVSEEIEALLADNPAGLNPKALYVVWAGPNDLFLGLLQPEAMPEILGQALANIADAVCQIGTAGGRYFMVGNMPDMSLTPFIRDMGPDAQAQISQVITQFNFGLEQTLANLPDACAGQIGLFDSYQGLQDIVASPEAYGLANVTDACLTETAMCANPDAYLFWDSVHPTTKGHEILANKFRGAFCQTGELTPGLHGKAAQMPPPQWRGACFGTP